MAKKEKINMPMSGAGITRYFEDTKSTIEFTPGHVIFLAIVIILLVIILNIWGNSWFGI
ncbi:MAG: preprotein translocase subunit Sec61beta [Nanoarchaeota archaeon]